MIEIKSHKVLKIGVKNLNERIYTEENIQSLLEKLNDKAINGSVYGQIGYPESFEISITKASHKVHKFYIKENFLMADIEILNNDYGKLLKDFEKGYVFRTRSAGTVNEQGVVNLKEMFTVDAITEDVDAFLGMMD